MNNNEIQKAIKLLQDNDYVVRKITPAMKRDVQQCAEFGESGGDMECCACACSMCIMQ